MIPIIQIIALVAILQNSPSPAFMKNMANAQSIYTPTFIGLEWACDAKDPQSEVCSAGVSLGGPIEFIVTP